MASVRSITLDDRAFKQGLATAGEEMKVDGELYVHEVVDKTVILARDLVRKHTGHLEASIGALESGVTETGPFVDVGTRLRYAMFVEYGTYKDRAQPFMRPALKMAAKVSGQPTPRSPRSAAATKRANKRAIIRQAMQSRVVTPAQARTLSRAVSSRFRFRARRRHH